MEIQFITDKNSKGIFFFINNLVYELKKNNVSVEINNWNEISLSKKKNISHFHYSNSTRKILINVPFNRSKVKVCTIHDIIPRNRLIPLFIVRCLYKLLNSFIQIFIVHTTVAKNLLIKTAPFIEENKIIVIPLGTVIEKEYDVRKLRTKYVIPNDCFVFLMVGYIKKEKGQLDVLEIYNELNLEKSMLIIIGKTMDSKIENRLNNIENKNIKYLGFINDDEMLDYIKLSDCLINYRQNSVGESSGPLLLALGSGKPIIATDIGSSPEIIQNAGLIIKPISKELRHAILEMYYNEHLKYELERNSKIIRENYNWSIIAKKHLEIYERG